MKNFFVAEKKLIYISCIKRNIIHACMHACMQACIQCTLYQKLQMIQLQIDFTSRPDLINNSTSKNNSIEEEEEEKGKNVTRAIILGVLCTHRVVL